MRGLGLQFPHESSANWNLTHNINLLTGLLAMFSDTVKFIINFKLNFPHKFCKISEVPESDPRPSAREAIHQTIRLPMYMIKLFVKDQTYLGWE